MSSIANIEASTWRRINDYIYALGCAENRSTLLDCIMHNVIDIVPADIGAGLINLSQTILSGFGLPEHTIHTYNERYFRLVPSVVFGPNGELLFAPDRVRWVDYPDSEFYADFARPQGLGFGMSALRPLHPFSLVFQRSSCGKGFSERENTILEILNPHINNFLSIREKYDLLSKKRTTTPEDIKACFPQLWKREAQVAERLCAAFRQRDILCPPNRSKDGANSQSPIYMKSWMCKTATTPFL